MKDKSTPPLIAVEEVVQAKLVEEWTRRARELNLKVRGLPLSHPSSDPMEVGIKFLRDTLDISDINLDIAWLGHNSTLFLRSEMQQIGSVPSKLTENYSHFPAKYSLTRTLPKHRLQS